MTKVSVDNKIKRTVADHFTLSEHKPKWFVDHANTLYLYLGMYTQMPDLEYYHKAYLPDTDEIIDIDRKMEIRIVDVEIHAKLK